MVLLITDGLDREGAAGLAEEMERLHKSCSRLVWLNPLLRYGAYEPKSQGNKAMLPLSTSSGRFTIWRVWPG